MGMTVESGCGNDGRAAAGMKVKRVVGMAIIGSVSV